MTRSRTLAHPGRLATILAVAFALVAGATLLVARDATVLAASRASRDTLHDQMRVLWEDHIVWTRLAIISIVDEAPDQQVTVERLLRNQDDIGDAIKPFYGEAAGEQLSALLREHILGAAAILDAAKTGGDVQAAVDAWFANADEISAFLAAANPRSWPFETVQAHMHDHLRLTLEEATARLEGRHADEVAAYDAVHEQILHMADMLSDGIIAQFPGRVR